MNSAPIPYGRIRQVAINWSRKIPRHAPYSVDDLYQEVVLQTLRGRCLTQLDGAIIDMLRRTLVGNTRTISVARMGDKPGSKALSFCKLPRLLSADISPLDLAIRNDRSAKLAAAMKALRPQWAAAVRLHYWDDIPTARIGELLGVNQSRAFQILKSARKQLRESLTETIQ